MGRLRRVIAWLDEFQQRHRPAAFVVGVVKKHGEDRGGNLAALLAYYGFFSVFPLLLVLVSVLGFVLESNAGFRDEVLDSSLANFPVIGDQIRRNVGSLEGSGGGLAVGLALALWAGMGVVRTLQHAMNRLWGVPRAERASYAVRTGKALLFLLILGLGLVLSSGVSSLAAGLDLGVLSRLGAFASSLALTLLVFVVAFRLLTSASISVREVLPGAALAAVLAIGLQTAGSFLVRDRISTASDTYGTFALVIGLLTWLYLGAQLTLLAAEVNVVRSKHLWPRSLRGVPTDADRRALEIYVQMERRDTEQVVESRINKPDEGSERR